MVHVGLIQRFHTAELLDVLGCFLFRDVQHVIDCHQANQHSRSNRPPVAQFDHTCGKR